MTKQEKIVISAYTGVLMCDISDLRKYIEKILGRPVYSHELADDNVCEEIKAKSKADFLDICANSED